MPPISSKMAGGDLLFTEYLNRLLTPPKTPPFYSSEDSNGQMAKTLDPSAREWVPENNKHLVRSIIGDPNGANKCFMNPMLHQNGHTFYLPPMEQVEKFTLLDPALHLRRNCSHPGCGFIADGCDIILEGFKRLHDEAKTYAAKQTMTSNSLAVERSPELLIEPGLAKAFLNSQKPAMVPASGQDLLSSENVMANGNLESKKENIVEDSSSDRWLIHPGLKEAKVPSPPPTPYPQSVSPLPGNRHIDGSENEIDWPVYVHTAQIEMNYKYAATRFKPPVGLATESLSRRILIRGLPKDTLLRDVLRTVKGGKLEWATMADTSFAGCGMTAVLVFVDPTAAKRYFDWIQIKPPVPLGFDIEIQLVRSASHPIPDMVRERIRQKGETRCIKILNFCAVYEATMLDNLRVLIPMHFVENMEIKKPDCFLSFTAIEIAKQARLALQTSKYRFKVEFIPDPCA